MLASHQMHSIILHVCTCTCTCQLMCTWVNVFPTPRMEIAQERLHTHAIIQSMDDIQSIFISSLLARLCVAVMIYDGTISVSKSSHSESLPHVNQLECSDTQHSISHYKVETCCENTWCVHLCEVTVYMHLR